jgi:hypothetical protein
MVAKALGAKSDARGSKVVTHTCTCWKVSSKLGVCAHQLGKFGQRVCEGLGWPFVALDRSLSEMVSMVWQGYLIFPSSPLIEVKIQISKTESRLLCKSGDEPYSCASPLELSAHAHRGKN